MVICVRNFRFLSVIILSIVFLPIRPTRCQLSATDPILITEEALEVISEEIDKLPGQEYFFDNVPRSSVPATAEGTESSEEGDPGEGAEGEEYSNENSPAYENESYEEFYDDNEDDACKERTYGRFLLIGSGILLVLGLCGIVCFTKRKDEETSLPSVTTCFRSCKVEDVPEQAGFVVNVMKSPPPPPVLSELIDCSSESDYQNIPLPLIYEDMGKICNNAEMFIQRCMTSSVKRTYSEPVKTLTTSKTKFRDYIKELAYLKEKQNPECSKHGAVRAFFKEMFKLFRKSEIENRRKRKSTDNPSPTKETRVKIEDSTKNVTLPRNIATGSKPAKKKDRESSSSISITSLLLKPQYQCKFYKKENTFDNYKTRRTKDKESKSDDRTDGEKLPLIINTKKSNQNAEGRRLEMAKDIRQHNKICSHDTEELIKICVNTMKQPCNKQFITLFDKQNLEQLSGIQDVAATMARKIAFEERREKSDGDAARELLREKTYCLPSSSKDMTPTKPKQSKEAVETIDLLVKQLYLMASNNRNLPISEQGGLVIPRDRGPQGDSPDASTKFNRDEYSNSTEEEARSRMIRKYQELQMEVERLNRSLRQFAEDFLYSDDRKFPVRAPKKKEAQTNKEAKKR